MSSNELIFTFILFSLSVALFLSFSVYVLQIHICIKYMFCPQSEEPVFDKIKSRKELGKSVLVNTRNLE